MTAALLDHLKAGVTTVCQCWAVTRSDGTVLGFTDHDLPLVFGGIVGAALIWHPDSSFPNAWNPTTPLAVADPLTPLTTWKLRRTLADPQSCLAALDAAVDRLLG